MKSFPSFAPPKACIWTRLWCLFSTRNNINLNLTVFFHRQCFSGNDIISEVNKSGQRHGRCVWVNQYSVNIGIWNTYLGGWDGYAVHYNENGTVYRGEVSRLSGAKPKGFTIEADGSRYLKKDAKTKTRGPIHTGSFFRFQNQEQH